MAPPEPVLQLAGATVVKDGVRVLDDVSLTIRAGEHTAIVGPNGAGKTTLINLLTHDDRALVTNGSEPPVRVFGHSRWNLFDLRSRLGVVSADLHQRFVAGNSFGSITGVEAVLSGLFGTQGVLLYSTVSEEMRERALDALARIDAAHLAAKALDRMSTGEARRVLIARALVTDPEALVLDEPSAGLDLVARDRFLESVARIARSGTTLVLVTHHVEEIVPEIERVVLMNRGRIAADGPKLSVLTSTRLSDLYGARVVLEEDCGYYFART